MARRDHREGLGAGPDERPPARVEYGGPGLGFLDGAIIEEEIAWGCSGIGTSLTCNGLATAPIVLAASDELKKQYLGPDEPRRRCSRRSA